MEKNIIHLQVGPLGTNCYLLFCTITRKAAVIDPGGDAQLIFQQVKKNNLEVVAIFNTHGHWDHIGANKQMQKWTGAPIYIHQLDKPMLSDPRLSLADWLGEEQEEAGEAICKTIADGDILEIGQLKIQVLFTPGHSPGGVSFLVGDLLFSGDALFQRSIGRTDLAGGDYSTLIRSIKEKILPLPDDTVVLPGHGPLTTVSEERSYNPYLRTT